jgi:alkylhydroperoxidase/carboxymuconolactone decarboxylase family protein YurZ
VGSTAAIEFWPTTITTHVDAAARHGATREEVIEALSVAIQVNAGAALVHSARTLDVFKAKVP